jgi:hypothetical protein
MTIADFVAAFSNKGMLEKEIFAEEVILYLDSFGFPAPSIIREKSNQFLLARYQNEFGDLPRPKGQEVAPICNRMQKDLGFFETLFELEDNYSEENY